VAESIVTLRVEARNAISSLNKTSAATKTLSNSAKGATASLTTASTAAKGLGASLAASLGPLISVGAAVATVSNAIATFSSRERDITILRQGLENLGAGTLALNELQEAADRLGNQTLFNQEEFTRGFNLLTSFRNIGVDSYSRVAQAAADIAQVNQVDVSTSFMQLAKALQDPERNLSNLNRSGIAFTKTQTEVIKELMKTNKTAEAHAMILSIVEESYNGLAQAASEGFAGSVDSLGEAFRDFSETLGKTLEPALVAATKGLTALIKAANDLFTSPLGKTVGLFTGVALAAKSIAVALPLVSAGLLKVAAAGGVATIALNAIPFVAIATAVGLLTTAFFKLNGEKKKFNDLVNQGSEDAVTAAIEKQAEAVRKVEEQLEKAGKRGKSRLFTKLEEEKAELRLLEGRLKTIESDKLIEESANKIVEIKKTEKNLQDEQTKSFNDFLKKQERQKELLEATINGNRKEVELQHEINDLVEKHGEQNRQKITDILTANKGLEEQANKTKAISTEAETLKEKFKKIGETVRTDLVNNLTDAIMGAKSFGDAMKGVLDNLKRQLIQLALNKAIGAIGKALMPKGGGGGFFSGLFGKRARGGPVSAGGAFVVGEKGPEILQMGSKGGNIIPNNALGGDSVVNNISINVDASGSAVSGSSAEGNQLGQQLAAAIQSELIKQKRAGGLLA
jgi:predicted nucleic acid-binding protein